MSTVATRRRRVHVEARGRPSPWSRLVFPVASILGAGLVGAILLLATGHLPGDAYKAILISAFGSSLAWVRTLIGATPLILTAAAAAVAFRMKVWNIGGEGQLAVGAIAASGVALLLGDALPAGIAIPVVLVAGGLGGAVWAGLAAVPRAYLRTDEVITTLMLNFVALHLMNYLIFGSVSFWRDTERVVFPTGRAIPEVTELPRIWLRLDAGFLLAVAVAAALWWFLRSSRWGYDVRVIGDSPRAAAYAGMNVRARLVSVLVTSGAIAGLAGAVHVSASTHALEPNAIAVGLGYTGIVVAAVARLDPLAIVPVAVLIAGLTNAGSSLQILQIPNELVILLQGTVLLLVAAGEYVLHNRITLTAAGRRWSI